MLFQTIFNWIHHSMTLSLELQEIYSKYINKIIFCSPITKYISKLTIHRSNVMIHNNLYSMLQFIKIILMSGKTFSVSKLILSKIWLNYASFQKKLKKTLNNSLNKSYHFFVLSQSTLPVN